jgi:hypothetical protein
MDSGAHELGTQFFGLLLVNRASHQAVECGSDDAED